MLGQLSEQHASMSEIVKDYWRLAEQNRILLMEEGNDRELRQRKTRS